MYVRPISTRLFCGRSTPAIRAMALPAPCHPWRCLCFGLSQITRITPRLLTILHLSQILFTEARTFMASSLVPVDDAPPAQVVRGQLDQDAVARQDPDEVLPHLAGNVGENAVLVVQLDAEHRVREGFEHLGLDLDRFFFRHDSSTPARRGSTDPQQGLLPTPRSGVTA